MSNSDLLKAVNNMSYEGNRSCNSILKLDWVEEDSELIFKMLKDGEFSFTTVLVLELERKYVIELLNCICECIRESADSVSKMYGSYDISISASKDTTHIPLRLTVMKCCGQKSCVVGTLDYTGYMSGKSLLDGIRGFRSEYDLY